MNFFPFIRRPAAGLKAVEIGVCNNCNINCLYCFEHSPLQIGETGRTAGLLYSKMQMQPFKKLIDNLAHFGGVFIRFAGRGESFLHPDFTEMCGYVRKKQIACDIVSNGTLINDEQAKAIADLDVEMLNISIGAAHAGTYHKMTNAAPETLEKITQMLKVVVDYKRRKGKKKPRIVITHVLCKLNFEEIVDMVKMGVETGADGVAFWRMYFCKTRLKLIEDLLLDTAQTTMLKTLIIEAMVVAKRHKLENNLASLFDIISTEDSRKTLDYKRQAQKIKEISMILADGSVYAWDYPQILGNINNASFMDIWDSKRYRQLRDSSEILCRTESLFPCVAFCRSCDRPLYSQ